MSELNSESYTDYDGKTAVHEDTMKDMFLCFEIGSENYAIEVLAVKEIINIFSITPVPDTPACIKGIVNLRGDIAPVMSVRLRFGKEEKEYGDQTCIIVLNTNDMIIGLIVDSVSGCAIIPDEDILPAPSAKLNKANLFVKNIGKTEGSMKLLIDVEKLLFS